MAIAADIDDREVQRFLTQLSAGKLKRGLLSAIRKGLGILARKTTENFRANRRGFTEKRVKRRTRSGKEKERILRVARVSTRNKDDTVKVHIMDDYRVKWFEMGTRERKTKGRRITGLARVGKRLHAVRTGKGHSTGRIRPEHFFLKAQRQTEGQVRQTIDTEMKKNIRKQLKK